jgi:basic membrane protein A
LKRLLVLACVLVLGVSLIASAQGKIAIVLDVGGRGDLSFNDMGFVGTDRAAEEFGLEMVEVQSASAADYLPNLRNLARTGEYDLIIAVGFLLGDALATASAEFPDQKFAIIDVDYITGPNIMNIVFRENEMSALIGCLAAMAAADHGYAAAGVVLGIPIPVLYHFEAGFRFGMDWGLKKYAELTGTEASVTMLYNYTGTFSDIALGKAASEAMLAQGAVGIYNVAGPLGVGDHEAVVEAHDNAGTTYGPPYYFGVDANQDWLGDGKHALASGMKRVDFATYSAVKAVVDGTFVGGVTSLGLAEGGVGISKRADLIDFIEFGVDAGQIEDTTEARNYIIANWTADRQTVAEWIWDAVDELEAGILDGSIVVPTANTDEEIEALRAEYPLQ